MENPKVSIITVGMNHLNYIKELYKSLYVDSLPNVSFEAIYVDNCSQDGSVKFLKENLADLRLDHGSSHAEDISSPLMRWMDVRKRLLRRRKKLALL